MDIVEFLRSVEWMCHSKMRGLMENDRPHEAADEIERLREIVTRLNLLVSDDDYAFLPVEMRKTIEALGEKD